MGTSLTSPGLTYAADKAIVAARKSLEKLSLFATDFSDEAVKPGTTLKVPVFSGTAQTFAASNQNYSTSNGNIKWAALTFDTHKKCTFDLDDIDRLLVEGDPLWDRAGTFAGEAVGEALVAEAVSKLTYSGATQVANWSVSLANMAALRANCAANNLDPAHCVVALEPVTFASVLALLPANVLGDGSAVTSGIIRGLFGFKGVIEANNVSKTSASGVTKGVGFVIPDDSLLIGSRIVKPGKGVAVEWGTQTDERSGLTIGWRVTADQAKGESYVTAEAIIGAALALQSGNGAPKPLQLVTA